MLGEVLAKICSYVAREGIPGQVFLDEDSSDEDSEIRMTMNVAATVLRSSRRIVFFFAHAHGATANVNDYLLTAEVEPDNDEIHLLEDAPEHTGCGRTALYAHLGRLFEQAGTLSDVDDFHMLLDVLSQAVSLT